MDRRRFLRTVAAAAGGCAAGALAYGQGDDELHPPPTQRALETAVQAARWWAHEYIEHAWGADTINGLTGEPVNPTSAFAVAVGHLLNNANILDDAGLRARCLEYLASHDARQTRWGPAGLPGICGEHIAFCISVYWLAYETSGDRSFRTKALDMAGEYLDNAFVQEHDVIYFSYDYRAGEAAGDQYLNHVAHVICALTLVDDAAVRSYAKRLASHVMEELAPTGIPYQMYQCGSEPRSLQDKQQPGRGQGKGYAEIWADHPITRQEMVTDFLEALCLAWRNTGDDDYRSYATAVLDPFLDLCWLREEGKLQVVDVETGEPLPPGVQFQHLMTCLLLRPLSMLGRIGDAEAFADRFYRWVPENGLYPDWPWVGWGKEHHSSLFLEPVTALLYLYAYGGNTRYLEWINDHLNALLTHAKREHGFVMVRTDTLEMQNSTDITIYGGGLAPAFVLPNLLKPGETKNLPDVFELCHRPGSPALQGR